MLAAVVVFFSLLTGGCATAPRVSPLISEAETTGVPEIRSAKGQLSPAETKKILRRIAHTVLPPDLLERQTSVVEFIGGSPLIKGNKVTLLPDGPETYDAIFQTIQNARDHINLETFIFDDDEEIGRKIAELLVQKRSEGVEVNLIYDSYGSLGTSKTFFDRLKKTGIRVIEFNPLNPFRARGEWNLLHRDHRKMLIADGKVVITGGVNISGVYSAGPSGVRIEGEEKMPWRDTDIRIEGPVVAEFQKLFLATWEAQNGPTLPERDYYPRISEAGTDLVEVIGSTSGEMNRVTFMMYVSAFTFAQKTIHLTNAYFVPEKQILESLMTAAQRGVDVKIILPGKSDSAVALHAGQYYYCDLLASGVKLYARRNAVLHAKTAVVDAVWSTVGSTNLDFLSILRNDEVNAIVLSREFGSRMEEVFAADLDASDEILWEEWKKRPLLPRLREWFFHLFAPLL